MTVKYVKPKSVTWWAGAALIGLGGLIGIDAGHDLGAVADIARAWTGNVGASVLIAQGAGLIGIREAIG